MRLPLDGAAPRRAQLATAVEAVLTSMLLTHVRGALVGEASGGERKRTNVALELVAAPACLVVDGGPFTKLATHSSSYSRNESIMYMACMHVAPVDQ